MLCPTVETTTQNTNIKVQDHTVHIDSVLVPVTRQNISKLFASCCLVTCVLTASQLLQGYDGIEPRAPLLADFNLVVLFCIRLHIYVQMIGTIGTTFPNDPGVKAPSKSSTAGTQMYFLAKTATIKQQSEVKKKVMSCFLQIYQRFPHHGLRRTSYRSILLGVLRASIQGEATSKD